MADEREIFGLDLDTKDFIKSAKDAKQSIAEIGDPKNLAGLISSLGEAAKWVGIVGVAAASLKVAFDSVFEAERIQKINNLFEDLTKTIGVASDAFKKSLTQASGGFADDTAIMDAANRSMINLGASAQRLPELMSIARKMTVQFGGDLIEKFNDLSFAVETGNMRLLRRNGIILDSEKVLRDFAKSHGVLVDSLTLEGRQQAILNAAIEQGNQKFKDSKDQADDVTSTWKRFRTEITDINELFTKFFAKLANPAVSLFVRGLEAAAANLKSVLQATLGEGTEQLSAKLKLLQQDLKDTDNGIKTLESNLKSGFTGVISKEEVEKDLAALKSKRGEIEKEIVDMQKAIQSATEKSVTPKTVSIEDQEKVTSERIRLENEVLQTRLRINEQSIQSADSYDKLIEAQANQEVLIIQDAAAKIQRIENDISAGRIIRSAATAEMEKSIEQEKTNKLEELYRSREDQFNRMEENRLRKAESVGDGIVRAAQKEGIQAAQSFKNMGQQGSLIFGTIASRGTTAFQELGAAIATGSEDGADVMKRFILGALGDLAQAEGQLMLLMSLAPPPFGGPQYAAPGIGLLVLAGALHALAGSAGSSGVSSSAGGGGGGYGYAPGPSDTYQSQSSITPAAPQQHKTTTVIIQGHYFDTGETAVRLMDIIRKSSDSSDFNYVLVGGQ